MELKKSKKVLRPGPNAVKANSDDLSTNIRLDYKAIGTNIKKERNKQKITQEQLAEKIGISTNFLACIELGIKHGSFETYIIIANGLHTTLDALTADVVYSCQDNPLKDKLNYCFDNASLQSQKLMVKIAEDILDADM